jgi:YHS domain-containing protein
MKRSYAIGAVVALALGFAAWATAQEKPSAPPTSAPAATAPATAPTTQVSATPVNKKCPVSGDAIDPKGKTVVYKGQTIGFCCDDCVEPFKKNPEKYAKNIK